MKTKIFHNLLFKILSVLLAILLWVIVVNIDDAVSSKSIKGVKVNLINTDVLTSQDQTIRVEEGTDTVDLVVYARQSVLQSLRASDFSATADVQKDLLYDNMVKIDVSYVGNLSSGSIEKIEQSRTNVLVSIENQVTEQFKVTVDHTGSPSDGLVLGSLVPEQSLVEITGPESVVERIKKVVATVDITGITGTAVRTCSLELQNSDGDPIDGTYLEYVGKNDDFEVTATTLNTKLVGISFDVSTAAPEGYGLTAITYKPETVTIAGERARISGISNLEIPAEALNPDGETGSVQQTVDISQYLPEGVIIPEEEDKDIVVTMEFQALSTATYVFTPSQIVYDNTPDGLEVDVSDSGSLELAVSGLPEALAGLSMEAVSVHADLSQCSRAGTYTVPVTATLPDGLSCPSDLTVSVRLTRAQ
ncbi:MAG: CdaR family protein [Eubacteriales bacterium]|nr:CdaR family protein [Eubacteriales bacterium]